MPSSDAQARLIRETYANAGLSVEHDRCQYFEAHGTGTKAGDPQEAGAIYQAFFGSKESQESNEKLYVGSIKTIIGHTEGTAGIAGLLRASLGMQHGFIPPNMLFDELNPDIEPYYGKLEILTEAKPWPKLPPGTPKRASVNSFGELCLWAVSLSCPCVKCILLITH
jgi:hybrid polyketide synthase/nonribosomal peptide synthetase ACE1